MHHFQVRHGTLFCEDCSVSSIAQQVGTPLYLYSAATFLDHLKKIQEAFEEYPARICYSVKANSNINILSLLGSRGAGADIVSGGELYRAIQAGIPGNRIVFSGAGKTDTEINYALDSEIDFFNVESIPELVRINELAGQKGETARICIRVNPDIDPGTHAYTATGKKETKFGLSIQNIDEHYRFAAGLPHLQIHGIDVHLGSPILSIDPYLRALESLGPVISRLRSQGMPLRVLDLGGGLGIIYKEETPLTAHAFAQSVLPLVRSFGLDLVLEPGRFICGNAGILVSRITYVKTTPSKTFFIVDGGMNDLIRPPLYGSYHEIAAVEKTDRPSVIKADVVGPICESSDFFGKDRMLPDMQPGELLAVMSAGAYGFSMASNYNSRPRAAEVLVEGDRYKIIRRRESFETLIADER